ncbi:hypothetical protein V5O48_017725 [Marasmius crinis-equi]|uniref:Uncharacterized protein n=1 Tax=Marasmius crinis-equi TaxID=585013 RepID=A0ABR3EN63_9AGAR
MAVAGENFANIEQEVLSEVEFLLWNAIKSVVDRKKGLRESLADFLKIAEKRVSLDSDNCDFFWEEFVKSYDPTKVPPVLASWVDKVLWRDAVEGSSQHDKQKPEPCKKPEQENEKQTRPPEDKAKVLEKKATGTPVVRPPSLCLEEKAEKKAEVHGGAEEEAEEDEVEEAAIGFSNMIITNGH